MRLSSHFRICEILGETYIVPEEFDKMDMSRPKRITGSGSQIIKEIEAGVSSIQDLKDRICTFYAVEDVERDRVCDSVESFVRFCTEKGYIELL